MMSVTFHHLSRRSSSDPSSSAQTKTGGLSLLLDDSASAEFSPTTPLESTPLKFSPDRVTDIVDPTTVECKVQLRMPTPKSNDNGKSPDHVVSRYNLPPIHTPLHTSASRKAPSVPLMSLDSLSRLPEDSIATLEEDPRPSGNAVSPPPKIPKPIPISGKTARRVQSDNFAQTKSNQRRSIFGHYFNPQHQQQQMLRSKSYSSHPLNSKNDQTQEQQQQSPTIQEERRYKLSSSGSILESAFAHPLQVDYRMFAPPKDHAHKSAICGRFHSVEDLSVTQDLQRKDLPPLPSPLRRFCSSSDVNLNRSARVLSQDIPAGFPTMLSSSPGTGMHGMYPLMTPTSILRQSSYSRSSSSTNGKKNGNGNGLYGFLSNSFNLTESSRNLSLMSGRRGMDFLKRTSSSTVSTTTASSDDNTSGKQLINRNNKSGVRFDPRVTVTEFEDSVQRVWYDDYELERLKKETIILAQEYLLSHPMEAEKYNRATMDPVTNTYRKRALFSLPALSSTEIESDEKDHSHFSLSSMSNKSLQGLAKDQVQRILIVDPNTSILALFCKSLSMMFPTAELVTAQSAERALKLVKASLEVGRSNADSIVSLSSPSSKFERTSSAFDIIIIEQSLYPHSPHIRSHKTDAFSGSPMTGNDFEQNKNESATELPWNSSMPDMKKHGRTYSLPSTKTGPFFHHDIANSMRENAREPTCGSELTRAIVELERSDSPDVSVDDKSTGDATAIASAFQWKPLLIGVSVHPDHHAKLMQEAGSDIIWGKPIPKVGDALRNQLLKALLGKRRGDPSAIVL